MLYKVLYQATWLIFRLAIPIIIILTIGGIISFFLAYSFYPKKNVNVNVDGLCFELVGSAFNQYTNL
ncbi:MAG: hypothetical protein ACRD8Z_11380, partial [Nitrososphaeraceae archaeon]